MKFNRRQLLKSMGQSSALLLPIMKTLRAESATDIPRKAVFLFWANGFVPTMWRPKGYGTSFQGSYCLEPLMKYRNDLIVIDRVRTGGLSHGAQVFLTGWPLSSTATGGPSLCSYLGPLRNTAIPSLRVSADNLSTTEKTWNSISYDNNGGHIAMTTDPEQAFRYAFNSFVFPSMARGFASSYALQDNASSDANVPKALRERRSMLDAVIGDFNSMKRYLSGAELSKLNMHFDLVRGIEKKLQDQIGSIPSPTPVPTATPRPTATPMATPRPTATPVATPRPTATPMATPRPTATPMPTPTPAPGAKCTPVSVPSGAAKLPIDQKMRLLIDIIVAALACGRTDVADLLMSCSVSYQRYGFLNGRAGFSASSALNFNHAPHHEASHWQGIDGDSQVLLNKGFTLAQLQKIKAEIDLWHHEMMALLIDRLIEFGIFESTVVLMGNEIDSGHGTSDVPFVMAGSCGGFFKTGQAIDASVGRYTHNSILSAIASAMGHPKTYGKQGMAMPPMAALLR